MVTFLVYSSLKNNGKSMFLMSMIDYLKNNLNRFNTEIRLFFIIN